MTNLFKFQYSRFLFCTMSIPTDILALLSKCTLSEKITILEALQKDIREHENTTDNESINNNSSVDYDTFVTSTNGFIEDENYLHGA